MSSFWISSSKHQKVSSLWGINRIYEKRNENNEITRYKVRLVAWDFSQRFGIDYETYSPMMDEITLRFLIGLTMYENLDMHLIDVVTTYLYGSLDNDIYMKALEGFKIPKTYKSSS